MHRDKIQEVTDETSDITQLLNDWRAGNRESLDSVISALYHELRRLANQVGAERPGDTMQATVLVNELYLRLLGQQQPDYKDREHFFCLAARAMRQIRIDHARQQSAEKRGGAMQIVPLEGIEAAGLPSTGIEDLHAALEELEKFDARKASMVDLRYFAGFSVQEVASAFGLSTATVRRDMRTAEAWLIGYLRPAKAAGASAE